MFCYPFEYVAFTRKEAQKEGRRFYRDGKPCKKGHWDKKNRRGACAQCERDRARVYKAKNREKIREHDRANWERRKEKYANDPDYRAREAYYGKMKARRYRNDPTKKDGIRRKNTAFANKRNRERIKNDPVYIWTRMMRDMIKRTIERGHKKDERMVVEMGYTPIELKEHIEALFEEGMGWHNRGEWHLDHIRPICTFPPGSHPSEVNALSNLRPIWAKENLTRSRKWQE